MLFPTIERFAFIELPFLIRIENLVIPFFMFKVLITAVMYYWVAKESVQRIFPKLNSLWLTLFLLIAAIIFSTFFPSYVDVQVIFRKLTYVGTLIAFGLPLLLLVLIMIMNKKKADRYEQT